MAQFEGRASGGQIDLSQSGSLDALIERALLGACEAFEQYPLAGGTVNPLVSVRVEVASDPIKVAETPRFQGGHGRFAGWSSPTSNRAALLPDVKPAVERVRNTDFSQDGINSVEVVVQLFI